jgi:hypothetical protein
LIANIKNIMLVAIGEQKMMVMFAVLLG